jgi:protein-tyrosine phosphatase
LSNSPHLTRRIPLQGSYNLRDTGGYPVGDSSTKWRKLFRSDSLQSLTDADRARLAELGIGSLIDLREDTEVKAAPNAVDGTGITQVRNPVFAAGLYGDSTEKAGAASALKGQKPPELLGIYRWLLAKAGSKLADAVRLIANSGDRPILVHCTAGKDRTGLVTALSLSAAGVADRDVVADYCLSEVMLAGEWVDKMLKRFDASMFPPGTDVGAIIASSPAPTMRQVLADIHAQYGDAAGYLKANGLTDDELAKLRTALVE